MLARSTAQDHITEFEFINPFADTLDQYLAEPDTFVDVIDTQVNPSVFEKSPILAPLELTDFDLPSVPVIGVLPLIVMLPYLFSEALPTQPDLLLTANEAVTAVDSVIVGDHYGEFAALQLTDLFDIELNTESLMATTKVAANQSVMGLAEQPIDTLTFSKVDILADNMIVLPDPDLINATIT